MTLHRQSFSCVLWSAMLALFFAPVVQGGQPKSDRPALTVPVVDVKPTIDGKLDDACWKNAAEIPMLAGADKSATSAWVCRDADNLYVAVRFKVGAPVPSVRLSDDTAHVAVVIDPDNTGNAYYLLSIFGQNLEASYREHSPPWYDWSWKPKFPLKVGGKDPEWIYELALPFANFNMTRTLGPDVGFNIRRQDYFNKEKHSWAASFPTLAATGILKGIPARSAPATKEEAPAALGPGSAHPGGSGAVKLELEGFLLGADPHARGVIWDLAANEKTGELFILSAPRVRNSPEVQVFDRKGKYLRTVMPFNPTLPGAKVQDLRRRTVIEAGVPLVVPKLFEIFGAVETSLYGEWWHLPQKMVVAPDGDLIMTNIFRGTLMRLRPDGSLPTEGWTSIYNPQRNEPFESTLSVDFKHFAGLNAAGHWYATRLDNYLPFPELFYPYMSFDQAGNLHIARGIYYQSSPLLRFYGVRWEVPREKARQLPDSAAVHWTMKVGRGTKVESVKAFGFDGKEEPLGPRPSLLEKKDKASEVFRGECGMAFDGANLILADRKEGKLLVFDSSRRPLATVSHYRSGGGKVSLTSPTALAVDNQGCVYVLVEDKTKRLIKLKSWREPELLAESQALFADTLQFVIDRQASPPLVWVANGGGLGTLVQLSASDLRVQGKWGDTGETLSSPGQQGYVPILNIDPETGHVYVEDDADYRFGKRGETYRLDQDGKILKKWTTVSKEVPRLETLFGKDGKLYWWERGKIWRYDRTGKPVPFQATGKEILAVDPGIHHVGVYFGMDVDRHGNIYCVNTKAGVDVFDADGKLKKKDLLHLNSAVRGIQVDAEGNIYALSRVAPQLHKDSVLEVYNGTPLHLCKYAPDGGTPIWSIPWTGITGRDQVLVAGCGCLRPRLHQALDGKGFLFVAGLHSIQIIDCATGKLAGEFGTYGNMDCQGKGSKYPHPELPFGTISAVAVHKDRLFAVDLLNRRIVKCRIVYGKGG